MIFDPSDDLIWRIREEAIRLCGDRIAETQRHLIPGKMPPHGGSVYFQDSDVQMSEVLAAVQTVVGTPEQVGWWSHGQLFGIDQFDAEDGMEPVFLWMAVA